MLNPISKALEHIAGTASYNDKLILLKKYENLEGFKDVLKFIYNPYCRTGISSKKIEKALGMPIKPVNFKASCVDAIEYFKTHQTGSDADLAYASAFIKKTPSEARWLAMAIVTQDLKIGITATSLNKAYGKDFIPKIGCMLGTLYGDVPADKVAWPCIVTEKLDGIRRILVKENGVVRCFSRSGHEDTGLMQIVEDAKWLPDNTVYDGELLAKGMFNDCIAQRQATNSIANSKGTKTGLVFNVFDMIPIDEFFGGCSKDAALNRKILLAATLRDENVCLLDKRGMQLVAAFGIDKDLEYIKPVKILGLVSNINQVTPIVEEIWGRGGEGVMLNTTKGKYEIKRSKQLLKIKHTEEHVLEIIDFEEGTGKNEDRLGAIIVDYKGNRLGVGSGFTDAMRVHIWENTHVYLGAKVEIETFGESTNAYGAISLNCPIFKRFVGEEE